MIRAHSLLYAIYICLIVSIICGALLYLSQLSTQLNLYYNIHEDLYLQNQSLVNYALANQISQEPFPNEESSEIKGNYTTKTYGLLSILIAQSFSKNDTISSAHFIGNYSTNNTGIHLANFSKSLNYTGNVSIIGDNYLPTNTIETSYINNSPNKLTTKGKIHISTINLPKLNPVFENLFLKIPNEGIALNNLEKLNDSIYFNSFNSPTIEVFIQSILNEGIYKGNYILRSKDSIRIKKNVILEDVIIIAPKITFEEGFSGSVQAFATKGIELQQKVKLNYPSVVCVYNNGYEEALLKIKKESSISGAIVMFGNKLEDLNKNTVEIDTETKIIGDIYCTGKLDLKSNVYGSVYTNRFILKTKSSVYENIIADIEINPTKKPVYFISIPLFETNETEYDILKKVL